VDTAVEAVGSVLAVFAAFAAAILAVVGSGRIGEGGVDGKGFQVLQCLVEVEVCGFELGDGFLRQAVVSVL
jgi:hypothetical protein